MPAACARSTSSSRTAACCGPTYPAAVVAGNVETSQHVTNAMFGAMGALANAQGTMNNLTFGNETYQYYETICSGSPAGRFNNGTGFHGTSACTRHMTNSRLTDPEILETALPGRAGGFPHPPGIRRQGQAGTPATAPGAPSASLRRWNARSSSSHRGAPPRGVAGGGDGQVGMTQVRRADGRNETLRACDQTVLEAGDAVIVTTPTPGGFGRA
jgi:5-oxoprolinase (ATP-hydrolysing)